MALSRGTRLGRYEVVRLLGAGGMGEVYLAKDERLQREVALKVLPTGTLADEVARRRFRNEAMALSKLDHPNIETVYDFDTQEGVDFLIMQYIPGETLDAKLATGPLAEKEVARLGTQIAEGLAAAHTQGVIHRDLKPGNLVVTPDGRMKLLDFGLAKLLPPVGEKSRVETATDSHAVSGTLPYMAPEQLRGETVDARTDIFALGAVLYEMATGKRPFREESSPRLTDAILHQTPVTPRAVNPRVSPDLERIVLKCLAKDPDNRYQSAKEIGVDLRLLGSADISGPVPTPTPHPRRTAWLVTGALLVVIAAVVGNQLWQPTQPDATPPSGKVMLAVLPLDNLSGDPEQEFFSDGMTDEMIAQLGRMAPQQLGVIARTSIMRFKNTERSIADIARDLQVDYILEGSVRRVGNTVRVSVQLIQADDQTQLWTDSYDREVRDVLALQSEVARAIAKQIKITLTPEQEAGLTTARPIDPEAFQAYAKGRYFWNKRTEEDLNKAIEYFEQAVAIDPNYAQAYAGLADAYVVLPDYSPTPGAEAFPKARSAANRALEIDETLAEAHTSLAGSQPDWSKAEAHYERAIELNPNYATAHQWYAHTLMLRGRADDAIREIKLAKTLDPLSPIIGENEAWLSWLAGRADPDATIEKLRRVLEINPNFSEGHETLGVMYQQKDHYERAIAEFQRARELSGGYTEPLAWIGHSYALSGRTQQARGVLQELDELSNTQRVPPWHWGMVHLGLGELDQTLHYIDQALQEEDSAGLHMIVVLDPRLAPLRRDPRFQELLRKHGLSVSAAYRNRE